MQQYVKTPFTYTILGYHTLYDILENDSERTDNRTINNMCCNMKDS